MESKCIPQFLITRSVKYVPLYNNRVIRGTKYIVRYMYLIEATFVPLARLLPLLQYVYLVAFRLIHVSLL